MNDHLVSVDEKLSRPLKIWTGHAVDMATQCCNEQSNGDVSPEAASKPHTTDRGFGKMSANELNASGTEG